jgi:hypothetical protein
LARAVRSLLGVALLGACAGGGERPSAWEAEAMETQLRTAGFRLIPADTPDRIESMRSLPALALLRAERDGVPAYVYADPVSCRCLWIGDPASYEHLRRLAREAERDELEAWAQDAALDWALWAP